LADTPITGTGDCKQAVDVITVPVHWLYSSTQRGPSFSVAHGTLTEPPC